MSTPHIAVAVSVIAAEHEAVSDPSVMVAMAHPMPRSNFTTVPDAAHMSPFLAPAELAKMLNRSTATNR